MLTIQTSKQQKGGCVLHSRGASPVLMNTHIAFEHNSQSPVFIFKITPLQNIVAVFRFIILLEDTLTCRLEKPGSEQRTLLKSMDKLLYLPSQSQPPQMSTLQFEVAPII